MSSVEGDPKLTPLGATAVGAAAEPSGAMATGTCVLVLALSRSVIRLMDGLSSPGPEAWVYSPVPMTTSPPSSVAPVARLLSGMVMGVDSSAVAPVARLADSPVPEPDILLMAEKE